MEQNTLWQNIWESARQQESVPAPVQEQPDAETTQPAAQRPEQEAPADNCGDVPWGVPNACQRTVLDAFRTALEDVVASSGLPAAAQQAVVRALVTTVERSLGVIEPRTADTPAGTPSQTAAPEDMQQLTQSLQELLENALAQTAQATMGQMRAAGSTDDPPGEACGDAYGELPACAPLANPYVPYQQENPSQYDQAEGLIRGTLFPGLDLPFLGRNNTVEKDTPLGRLMALCFAVTELGMYLDTHRYDEEVLVLFRRYAELYASASAAYEKVYGPLRQAEAGQDGSYNWTQDPWPWDYVREV